MADDEMGERTTSDEGGSPSLRQRLHAATGDRDAEAEALADEAGGDVDTDDAKVAVQQAHGESVEGTIPEPGLATEDDARRAAAGDDAPDAGS